MTSQLFNYYLTYGAILTAIAILGIAILGIMKYCNLFKQFSEEKRHYIYLAISVGFTLIATAIYLLIVDKFSTEYFLLIAGAIFALNQVCYNVFKVTPINKIVARILDYFLLFIKIIFTRGNGKIAEPSDSPDDEKKKE